MKKIFCAAIMLLLLVSAITGCAPDLPRPEVKEGSFNISVTYEHDGEIKVASAVYTCKYRGVAWTMEASPYINWKTSIEGDLNEEATFSVCTTDDGGEIVIALLLYPEYFMGDPAWTDYEPLYDVGIYYYAEDGTVKESSTDPELVAEYGVKLISVEYDKPIENTYS